MVYAANLTENPRSMKHDVESTKSDGSDKGVSVSIDPPTIIKVGFLIMNLDDDALESKHEILYIWCY